VICGLAVVDAPYQRVFVAPDSDCGVGCVVGVNPDDHCYEFLLRGRLGTARTLLVWISCLFLFRATRGEVQTAATLSKASQPKPTAGT
jgi:hypothetical protein